MEHESAFLIRSPEKIISKLSILLKKKCLLTVYFGDNNNSFITLLLDIHIKNNRLVFDYSPKQELIELLFNSPKIIFKTEYLGIQVSFNAIKAAKIQHDGVLAFAIPIPESILWMERREFYRVKSPLSKNSSYCQLTLNDQEPINLKLNDISLTGFSVFNAVSEISELLIPDTHFEQCKLRLADTGEDTVSFEVKGKCIVNPGNLNKMERIGCKFTQITPAFETTIQRYILQIERETKLKKDLL